MNGEMKTSALALVAIVLAIVAAVLYGISLWAAQARPTAISTPASSSQAGGCIVGGCSKELCTDASEEPAISPCIYMAQFACYKTATCERQADGQCSWTQTPELKTCIANAR